MENDDFFEQMTFEEFQKSSATALPKTQTAHGPRRTTVAQALATLSKNRNCTKLAEIAKEKQLKLREDGWKPHDDQQLIEAKLARQPSRNQQRILAQSFATQRRVPEPLSTDISRRPTTPSLVENDRNVMRTVKQLGKFQTNLNYLLFKNDARVRQLCAQQNSADEAIRHFIRDNKELDVENFVRCPSRRPQQRPIAAFGLGLALRERFSGSSLKDFQ